MKCTRHAMLASLLAALSLPMLSEAQDATPPRDLIGISNAPLNVVNRVPPNVLLILDNSESGQEGLDGRVAIGNNIGDRESSICRGPSLNATNCPAGAASPLSKSSIMKSVGLQIINDYRHSINLGLMAYQQNPASRNPRPARQTQGP